ncbi:Fe-S protein assembly co-chaperone HscB [Anaplasma capra]|uniref:Fe-S protein assembly co-chaperone HscB n=1 Tax=Anaplasma capra TaxID=1562740 RepID=UPI0021D608FC|nr:Fe-S protein assembly co-chaperone HscB [Anaplasma capra]MCU7611621.1 Fe-S protein assembly co-chaperone HscB [Anaplasma capra]MCU7612231.1 Fe-S protein assembly co-chaperone HscB [Anaplasma capra]
MSENYFSLLGLEVSFFIDVKAMERNYIAEHSGRHPDCFSSPADRDSAARYIAKVNEAYLALKSPLTRAEYILKLSGTTLQDEDRRGLVSEVFTMFDSQDPESGIKSEISKCWERVERSFAESDMYQAALQVEKLKYLKKLDKSGDACNF